MLCERPEQSFMICETDSHFFSLSIRQGGGTTRLLSLLEFYLRTYKILQLNCEWSELKITYHYTLRGWGINNLSNEWAIWTSDLFNTPIVQCFKPKCSYFKQVGGPFRKSKSFISYQSRNFQIPPNKHQFLIECFANDISSKSKAVIIFKLENNNFLTFDMKEPRRLRVA